MEDTKLRELLTMYFEESHTRYCTYEPSNLTDDEYKQVCLELLKNYDSLGVFKNYIDKQELTKISGIYSCSTYPDVFKKLQETYD